MSKICWVSEVKTVTNEKTGKTRYYFLICDVWQRVSVKDYQRRCIDADRVDSFYTKIRNGLIHQYKTLYGEYESKLI